MDDASLRRKRSRNGWYVWLMHGVHLLLDLLPAAFRVVLWRPFLGACGRGVFVDHKVYFKYPWLVELGDDVSINRGVEFFSGMVEHAVIRIGSRVRIAPNVRLHAAGHNPDHPELADAGADIVVGDDAWLGAAAVILPGVHIGPRAVVAAGAVVTADVVADAIVAGVPARLLRLRTGPGP